MVTYTVIESIFSHEHKKIINKLKGARHELGLTQREVAAKLGKPHYFISRIEIGQAKIDVVLLKRLARIYKKPVGYFLD